MVNFDNFERLTGWRRVYKIDVGTAGIDYLFKSYWLKTSKVEVGSAFPSIFCEIRPIPAIGRHYSDGVKFQLGDEHPTHEVGTNTSISLTATMGEPKFIISDKSNRLRTGQQTTVIPMRLIIDPPKEGYIVYAHSFVGDFERVYIGVTGRTWIGRWNEHLASARRGSPYLFHEAIRADTGVGMRMHRVLEAGLSLTAAMEMEERLVREMSLYPKGLNMIPGGYEGLRYLSQRGFVVAPREMERRDDVIRKFVAANSRRGKPNPLISARWREDHYAVSVICNNPRNFTEAIVNEIRFANAMGRAPDFISQEFGVAVERIRRLLANKTYRKVT